MAHKKKVLSLIYPHDTEMDLSIAFALYFAARGTGDCYVDQIEWQSSPPTVSTSARVLLSGLGADELFGGYSRHEAAFKKSGYSGLIDELKLDVSRIGQRNLGRDDRIMAHWGREVRFPYLDEEFFKFAINSPVWEKCDFENVSHPAVIDPAKRILRLLAHQLDLPITARQKKRAVRKFLGMDKNGFSRSHRYNLGHEPPRSKVRLAVFGVRHKFPREYRPTELWYV